MKRRWDPNHETIRHKSISKYLSDFSVPSLTSTLEYLIIVHVILVFTSVSLRFTSVILRFTSSTTSNCPSWQNVRMEVFRYVRIIDTVEYLGNRPLPKEAISKNVNLLEMRYARLNFMPRNDGVSSSTHHVVSNVQKSHPISSASIHQSLIQFSKMGAATTLLL